MGEAEDQGLGEWKEASYWGALGLVGAIELS